MRVLIVDNYDSFTYNLVQRLGELGATLEVVRNDCTTPARIARRPPDRIIISPGPGDPGEAGISIDVIRKLSASVPLLGVCLGHQAIGAAFGARIVRAGRLMHGKTSEIRHDGKGVYKGLSNPFVATRYHSLVVEEGTLSGDLTVVSRTVDRGEVMGLRHRKYPLEGVQFHPESFLTAEGTELLRNFLDQ